MLYHVILSGNFKAWKFGMEFFGALSFSPGIFLGFVGSPRDFLGFDFCPHSIIPVTRNLEYPPWVYNDA